VIAKAALLTQIVDALTEGYKLFPARAIPGETNQALEQAHFWPGPAF